MEKEREKLNRSALETDSLPSAYAKLERLLASLPEEPEPPPPDLDFDGRVARVLMAIRTDRVFAVNFKNSPLLALEDVLGQNLPDNELRRIAEEVRRTLSPIQDRREMFRLHMLQRSSLALEDEIAESIRRTPEKTR
jgi:hypothetical protein